MNIVLAPLTAFALFIVRLLSGIASMILAVLRPALRFLGAVLLLAAAISLTSDLTRWQTEGAWWHFDSLSHHIAALAPQTLKNMGESISQAVHPWLWDPIITTVIGLPAWVLFVVLGGLLIHAGRERRRINIFIN